MALKRIHYISQVDENQRSPRTVCFYISHLVHFIQFVLLLEPHFLHTVSVFVWTDTRTHTHSNRDKWNKWRTYIFICPSISSSVPTAGKPKTNLYWWYTRALSPMDNNTSLFWGYRGIESRKKERNEKKIRQMEKAVLSLLIVWVQNV